MCVCVCVCVIMKTMCPPGYHHNGFVATHALGHYIYIYIYKAEINDKEYYFFSKLRVSCCLCNNLQPNLQIAAQAA